MICTQCKKEIADGSLFCNHCGEKIEQQPAAKQIQETVKEDAPTQKRGGKKKKIFIASAFILIVAAGFGAYQLAQPYIKYNQALSQLENKEFAIAIDSFSELKSFKDAPQKRLESKYEFASEYMRDDNFEEAIEIFEELGTYSDSEQMLLETKFLQAQTYYYSQKYKEAVSILEKLDDYEKADELLVKANYAYGVAQYKNGSFRHAKVLFEKNQDYKEAKEYLKNTETMLKFSGTWQDEKGYQTVIFSGWQVGTIYSVSRDESILRAKATLKDNKIYIYDSYSYELNNDELVERSDSFGPTIMKKISSSTDLPSLKSAPAIGMTKEEVKQSTWGHPDDINRTETKNGVREQWVYDYKGYIYLDDGIVTGIQD